jgi:hypothetical protein
MAGVCGGQPDHCEELETVDFNAEVTESTEAACAMIVLDNVFLRPF